MATKLVLQSHPHPVFIFPADHFLRKQSPHNYLSLFTSFSTVSSPQTLTLNPNIIYGPSLHKGANPSQSSVQVIDEDEREVINKESFSRIFELSALRVPAEECFALENRLRGHLLNWPRVRNIARVPGDEMEDEFKKILPEINDTGEDEEEKKRLDSLDRRLYGKADDDGEELSPVLYRDSIMKSFNSRGYVNFRNVAKISRPKKNTNKRRDEREGSDREKRIGKNDFAVVEVVENENDDFSGLLGEDFKRGRWRGSTRLLLLDENLANKSVKELTEAVKVAFFNTLIICCDRQSRKTISDLVRCKLTLFYSYWQMNEILEALLPEGAIVPSSFETIGHIAHLNLRDEHLPYKKLIAQVVLDKNKPKIQTVVNKVESIQNEYRTMQLEVLAGNNSLVATVTENGIRFHVDLAAVYWNSKLATERQRLINRFTSSDIVCDVFSGVGPIALAAAKKVKHVYANDLNPAAVEYLERNCVLNKLERKIKVSNMDARINSHKAKTITQVVMNLPNNAEEYLVLVDINACLEHNPEWCHDDRGADRGPEGGERSSCEARPYFRNDAFRGIFVKRPKEMTSPMPMIHIYGFSNASDPEFDFHQRIRISLKEVTVEVEMHRVRHVAPGKWMLCASFVLPEIVAFASQS